MRSQAIVLSLSLLLLAACASYGGVQGGQPVWDGYTIKAMAFPWGPVYFGPGPPVEFTRRHEWCHVERMWGRGLSGVWDYTLRYGLATRVLPATSEDVVADRREWACLEERICGYPWPHPVCD